MIDNKSNCPYFDKRTTDFIKGIALIMMFFHHFFTFPERWVHGIDYPFLEKMSVYICEPFKMCVSVFCFLTGYFYYFNNKKNYKYSLKKVTDIYINYWAVWLLLMAVSILICNCEYTRYSIIMELFGLENPTMIHCWYVVFYSLSMLALPIIIRIMSKNLVVDVLMEIMFIPLVFNSFGSYMMARNEIVSKLSFQLGEWLPVMLMGYLVAKYKMFEKLGFEKIATTNRIIHGLILLLLAIIIPMGKYVYPYILFFFRGRMVYHLSLDIIYAPIFIYVLIELSKFIKWEMFKNIIGMIGKQSLLMWFVSCIFDNNSKKVFQPILFYFKNPALILIWGLMLCYVAAIIIDTFTKRLIVYKNKLFQ